MNGVLVRARGFIAIAAVLALCPLFAPRFVPLFAGTAAAGAQSSSIVDLQRDVEKIIGARDLESALWGISVRSLTANDTVYSLNAGKLMMPASTLKVVTVATAAERLGWDFAYDTRVVADGTIAGDTLEGNLVIVGSGDPTLDRPSLDTWVVHLKKLGIAKVTGTVLADARAFHGEGLGFGWSWDDLAYYYAAPIAAAQYRENAVDLVLRPGVMPGASPSFELVPPDISGLVVENHMTTGPASATPEFAARRAPHSASVVLDGVVPAGSKAVSHPLSVHDPVRYLAAAFVEALLAGGIAVGAPPPIDAATDGARDFSGAPPLLTHRSLPLRLLARRLMEVSQNQYSETLIKTMGAQGGDATFEGGLKAEETVLAAWGIPAEAAVLRDGSGLSRYDYVRPDTLIQVLSRMYREQAHRDAFFALLNVAGQGGTLANRMKNTPAEGNVRAKDGSMAGVRALCGILQTSDRETLVFAILANNFAAPGPAVTAAIDAIVVRLIGFRR
jgi:D-alanyl-D-alanine carboxypeptidase/D-alanyl-D-alanine-endopeptidase (penicillin-binding protein 4)